jgi:uncharacterized repeat protein (TIGR01451 family)
MRSIRKTAVQTAGRALLVVAQLMAIIAGVVQPALPAPIASLQPLVGAPRAAFAAGEVVRITKVVTTTDGSALPAISGNFTLALNCIGAGGFPTTTQVAAGGATNYTTVTSGTQCLASEEAINLPTPPAGYTWAGWTASAPVTVTSNATRTLTVTNFLAPTFATATSVLTVTKMVNGAAQPGRVYTMTVTGPNSYSNTFTLTETAQLTRVLTGLTPGIYTVTEQSPGAGWGTSYAVTNGTGITSSSNAVMTLSGIITATPFNVASITGTVYSDFNADGNINGNGLLTDTGVASVTVTAFALNGTTLGPVQTDTSGRYTITTSGTQGPFRLEFTKLPPDYEPSRVFTGTQNGTSVQFINTAVQATGANFGIVVPCETCLNSNPLFAATRSVQVSDPPTAAELAISSIRDFPYSAGTTNPAGDANTDTPITFTLAVSTSATGNIGAMTYDNANQRLYMAAYFKRHTIFGPGGPNAIYVLNTVNNTIVQTITVPGPATNWHDTTNYYNDYRISGTVGVTNSFDATGKSSLGGMELAQDGQHLFIINLENRTIYKIHISTGVTVLSVPTPLADCTNNDARPYALKFYRGKLYLGVTCTAETSQITSNLRALVYTVDPNSLFISAAPVFSANLNYPRGFASYVDANGAVPAAFNAWTNVYRRANAVVPASTDPFWVSYPQPYLSDLDFDNGNLILALRDRFSDQTGNNRPISSTGSSLISSIAAGDLLRACGNAIAGWTLESNRTCGGATASATTPVSPTQGPGGLEYYADGYSVNRSDPDHDENATGSIFQLPGSPLLMAVVYDPIPTGGTFDGGVAWFNNSTGQWVRGFRTIDGGLGGNSFGKSSGMGDTSAICNPPPLEIGNRVWDDVNGNGVQDPGEPGLNGVNVTLSWTGGSIATTSNINGNYYFTREAATGAFSQTLQQFKAYTITFSVPAGYSLTVPNAQAISGSPSSNDAISDTRDSDAVPIANVPTILYTTGAYGENNHGLDAGFTQPRAGVVNVTNTPPPPPQVKIVKYTNGFDADTGTGPFIGAGRPVTWTYAFTNTGQVTLTNLALNDTPAGAVTSCSPSLAGLQLAPGGRVTCTLTSVVVAGVYSNTAVVSGTSALTGQPVSDTNPSRYFGAQPALVLRKFTNGYDADTLPLTCNGVPSTTNQPCVAVGSTVTWTYIVTNTGNMTLTFAINGLTDDKAGPINTSSAFTLTPGATTTFTKTGIAVAGQYTNTGIVTGTPVLPPGTPITPDIPFTPTVPVTNPLTSTNPSHYFAATGSIVLRKYTNGYDADTLPLSCNGVPSATNQPCVAVGSTVTWTYVVTNTGNVTLSVAVGDLRDDKVGPINGTAFVLNPNETRTFTQTGTAVAGQYTNTAVVTGTNPVLTSPVTSTNPSHYFGDTPGIVLRKYTNGFDADNVTGPYISVGQPVTWTFVATNTGTTALTMTLTDDKLGLLVSNGTAQSGVVCTPAALTSIAPGGVVTCTRGGIAALGQYTNTGIVTGTPPSGPPVTSTNPSHYYGAQPAIVLRKYTNGFDADTLADPRPVLAPNAPVVWTYVITNTGNMSLALTLVDDRISTAGASCAPVALDGQLAAGRVTTCTLSGTALVAQTVAGIYTNTAVVTGTPVLPSGIPITPDIPITPTVPVTNPVTSTNPSHYEVYPQFGDRVWLESDGDGNVNTAFVSPIAGMVITATNGVVVYTTTTNVNGYYSFTLPAGTYTVTYGAVPPTYGPALPSATPASNSASGNVGSYQGGNDQSRPQNATVTLAAGQANWTMDYAFTAPKFDLGNRVWADTNNNGVMDGSEVGIANVVVTLQTPTTTLNTLTDASGYYSFTNLPAGVYTPVIAAANFQGAGALFDYVSSFGATSSYTNTDNARDHGIDPGSLAAYPVNGVRGAAVTLAAGIEPAGEDVSAPATPNGDVNNNLTLDFGFYKLSLGNQVWEDNGAGGGVANNGLRDGTEPGIAGVPVTLWRNGNVVSTTVTDGNGIYGFTDLLSGTYSITVQLPAGYVSSQDPLSGGNPDNQTDNDDNGIGKAGGVVSSASFNLTPGAELNVNNATGATSDPTIDFGAWKPSGLGDYVWYDLNHDGVQNNSPSEAGVSGVTVTLWSNGVPVSTTFTDATGFYVFTNLVQGTYSVTFGLPGTLTFTVPSASAPDASDTDSDATSFDGHNGSTAVFALGYGEYKPQIDAGVWRPAGLGDTIWIDTNGNGVQEPGEPGVPGVTATLFIFSPTANSFVQISQTVTGNGGYYEFTNLISATYQVVFDKPQGYAWTIPNAGSPISDSNVITPAMGGTLPVVLMENEFNPTIDGGLVPLLVNLGNQVWFDTNDNGLRDASEVGIAGVRVELYRDSDNSGAYSPGTDAFVDAKVTDASGYYTFTDLLEGRYVVVIAGTNFSANGTLAGYRSSTPTELDANTNVDDNDDGIEYGVSAFAPAYVASSAIDLKAGEEPSQRILPGDSNWTVDFGFFRLWLGGTIWLDVNYDGLLNDGTFAPGNPFVPAGASALEPGMPNIPVDLLDPQGNLLASTTTDASGVFTFTGLTSGSYAVRTTAPDGKRSTIDVSTTADPNNDVDNDDNGIGMNFVTISSGLMTIVPGAEPVVDNATATSGNPTLDFGLITGPLLIIRKTNSTDGTVRPNDLITYTLTVTNIGVTLVRNVVVSDNVPANTTFVSASGSPVVPIQNGPPVVWQVGDMPPGAVFVGTFVVRVFSQNLSSNVIVNAGVLRYDNPPTETVSVPTNEVVNPLAPTAVTLSSFTAMVDGNGVKVTWQTALERNTFAFNVLRSVTGRREDAVQVNSSPLPAVGPSTYTFVDAQGGVGNSYWIEEIELDGARNEYGPATAQAALPAVSQPQPAQQVVAPPAVQAPVVDAAAGVGGGVAVVQPVAQPQVETPAQPAAQAAAAAPAVPAMIAPAAQPAQPAAPPEQVMAQPAAQPEAQQPAAQPIAQSEVPAQPPAPQQQTAPALPPAEQVVVGAQSGVNVARGGQAVQPKLPQTTATVAPAEAAQPVNPLLPVVAGMLALFGMGAAGVFVMRRRKAR